MSFDKDCRDCRPCETCHGDGKVWGTFGSCTTCSGTGGSPCSRHR